MSKIKSLQVNLPMHSERYVVGEAIFLNVVTATKEQEHRLVSEIKDMSVEYVDAALHLIYEIFVDGQLFRRIENTPVTVEYEVN